MGKLRLFSMFAGYGGAEFALQKAGVGFETIGYSEIDKYAIQCYEQNHCKEATSPIPNYGDATKINEKELPDFDILTGGFPCQSFSIAGKNNGELDSRGTLFWDILRIVKEKKPKYILLENVKGLTFKNHRKTFEKILYDLDNSGYNVKWKVLNSKDYGTPQSRERVWFACVRKGVDSNFKFPKKEELKISIMDLLEEEVDEKYFLTSIQMENLISRLKKNDSFTKRRMLDGDVSKTLLSRDYKDPKIIKINNPKHSNDRVYDPKGISPTLNTMQGGNRQPFIINPYNKRKYQSVSGTLEAPCGTAIGMTARQWYEGGRVRKLTPTECFRLMGFFSDEISLRSLSNTQKYKLAGNGWEIGVVSKIFKNLLL